MQDTRPAIEKLIESRESLVGKEELELEAIPVLKALIAYIKEAGGDWEEFDLIELPTKDPFLQIFPQGPRKST